MAKQTEQSIARLYNAIVALENTEESEKFLCDILSIKEIAEISQRLEVAKLLRDGWVYTDISAKTGASTATISRVNRCLNYGEGGYEIVLSRLAED